MASNRDHRGRWQAQGGGLQASQPWAQASPLTAVDGESLLARLEAGLNSTERTARADCFRQARAFIDRAAKAGGIDATYVRSFTVTADTVGRRVDVEIRAGKAFVP